MIVSTPHKMNMFYKMWMMQTVKEMITNLLKYIGLEVPKRDEKWKEQTIRNTSLD